MLGWFGTSGSSRPHSETFDSVVTGLQDLYTKHVLPLEKDFKFNQFYSPFLTDGDFSAKPMVLLLGQYSTGKTTFIQHLLERDYPGQRIGPEPTTDHFVTIMHGDKDQVVPGNAAVVDRDKPWSQLAEFGNAFLARFSCVTIPSPIVLGLTLIDTPGVLSGNKQSERGYCFEKVIQWFAERVDLILLMFDAHKLDISDEFRRCIHALHGNDDKIRIILNKADLVSPQKLMRVYGALMWSLGKVIPTPQVARVYLGSFWDAPLKYPEYRSLFEAEASDLYSDIAMLPNDVAIRKLNDFLKRCRLVKVHVLLLNYLRKQLPLFGKTAKLKELLDTLETTVYASVSHTHGLPLGDFPSADLIRERLGRVDVSRLPRLDKKRLQAIDDILARRIPALMKLLPTAQEQAAQCLDGPTCGLLARSRATPFLSMSGGSTEGTLQLAPWAVKKYLETPPDVALVKADFEAIGPNHAGVVTGEQARLALLRLTSLPSSVLHRIWNLADVSRDGCLDLYEYALVRHFIDMKLQGFEVPLELPDALRPPSQQNALSTASITTEALGGSRSAYDASLLATCEAPTGTVAPSTTPQLLNPLNENDDTHYTCSFLMAPEMTSKLVPSFETLDPLDDGPFQLQQKN